MESLDGGKTVVIGAPFTEAVGEDERRIEPGATVVLFTDGLVERPGGSLDDAIDGLADAVSSQQHPDAEVICDDILSGINPEELRDDVALLVLRLPSAEAPVAADSQPLTSSVASGTDLAP
jgi:serine phosphatase RsbU (regulator of sigma subunit)